jgi:predicted CopG family antitoxin
MTQKNRKTIMVSEDTYDSLRNLGTVAESFNDVITRLIQKAASAQDSLEGTKGRIAAAPLQPGGNND